MSTEDFTITSLHREAQLRPGDQPAFPGANRYGFRFTQYGPRVPAAVISPLIPANTIDDRPYDHSSILATIEPSNYNR